MDANSAPNSSKTVEKVYRDFRSRRAGIIKALTTDVEDFYQQCDPEKENLCLYGFANEQWQVNLPAEEVPPELPEPALGINFARDGMKEEDWLSLVAVHSDSWLISVAFYFGARFNFDRNERNRLFDMLNELPTIYEVVTRKYNNVKTSGANRSSNKNKSNSEANPNTSNKHTKGPHHQEEGEDLDDEEDEHAYALCGICKQNNGTDVFWICCDLCEQWFHGKCVKITPARAEFIKQYKCPSCTSSKRHRPS